MARVARMGARWAKGGLMAHGRSRAVRVAKVREEGSWLWYARRARGRGARGGRGTVVPEAGAWLWCARRARGKCTRGGVTVQSMAQVHMRNYGLT